MWARCYHRTHFQVNGWAASLSISFNGPLRTFAGAAIAAMQLPEPVIQGIVQQALADEGRLCGTFLPFAAAAQYPLTLRRTLE